MSLPDNTTALEELLELANTLPDAEGGADPVVEALSVTENGTYTAPDGVDGYSPVTVNVTVDDRYDEGYSAGYDASQSAITLQEKTVTENGEVTADEGYTGLSKVTVDVPIPDGYIVPSGELEVTENGTHDVTEYASVNVNVAASGGSDDLARSIINRSIAAYSDDEVTTIGAYAFYNCTKLTEVSTPAATSIGAYAFQGSAVSHLSFPNFTGALVANTLRGATKLATVDFPLLTSLGNASMYGCTALKSVTFPAVTLAESAALYGCTVLEYVDLPVCTTLKDRIFYNCSALTSLILRNTDAVCTLSNVSTFTGTKIASGTGYIYVPAALLEDGYKTATNWSTYADRFRALEDYTVDGTITGELDETKI